MTKITVADQEKRIARSVLAHWLRLNLICTSRFARALVFLVMGKHARFRAVCNQFSDELYTASYVAGHHLENYLWWQENESPNQ